MKNKKTPKKEIAFYTTLPYSVYVEPQDDGKGNYFVARVVELPDLFMTGSTREEAIAGLEAVKKDWIIEYLKLGNKMPRPLKSRSYSGKVIVRMPPFLHEALTRLAETEGVSFNQYMVTALARSAGRDEVKSEHLMVRETKREYKDK